MTREELEAIKAREREASPGPWVRNGDIIFSHGNYVAGDCDREQGGLCLNDENAKFVVAARTDIPALITSLEEAWAEIEKMREDSRHESMDRDLCE